MIFKEGKNFKKYLMKIYEKRVHIFFGIVILLSFLGFILSFISFRSEVDKVHSDHLQESIKKPHKPVFLIQII